MLGGSAIKAVMYGINVSKGKADPINGFQILLIVIAMVVAFVVSLLTIKYFLKLIRTKTFIGFGIYRVVFGVVLLIIFYVVNKGQLDVISLQNSMNISLNSVNLSNLSVHNLRTIDLCRI